jgi:hypothetical protein
MINRTPRGTQGKTRRLLNRLLTVLTTAILIAVIVDVFNIGPRKTNRGLATATLIPPAPTTLVPVFAPITIGENATRKNPIKVCPVTRVMLFGDSLTTGFDGYRGPLFDVLQLRHIPVDFVGSQKTPVENAGVGGDPDHESHPAFLIGPNEKKDAAGKPANLSDNVELWLSVAKPNVVLLLVGAEELRDPSVAVSAPAAYTALVSRIKAASPGAILILSEVPPNLQRPLNDPALVALNRTLKTLAGVDTKDRVFFAPIDKKLADLKFDPKKDLYEDGVRFRNSGGRKYAIAIEPIIAGGVIRDRNNRCSPKQRPRTTRPSPTVPSLTTIPPADQNDIANDDFVSNVDDGDFVTPAN